MKFKFFVAATIITSFLFTLSCNKDKAPEPIPFECADTTISYSISIEPLVMQNCAVSGCHNSSGAGGYVFESYISIEENKDIILRTIQHNEGVTPMPIGSPKLTIDQIQSFNCWIEQGALDN